MFVAMTYQLFRTLLWAFSQQGTRTKPADTHRITFLYRPVTRAYFDAYSQTKPGCTMGVKSEALTCNEVLKLCDTE